MKFTILVDPSLVIITIKSTKLSDLLQGVETKIFKELLNFHYDLYDQAFTQQKFFEEKHEFYTFYQNVPFPYKCHIPKVKIS